MFSLVPLDTPHPEAILMLCRTLGILLDENELALILRNVEACFRDPRKAAVRRIAERVACLSHQPKSFGCTVDTLAQRAQTLDWYSPRFLGYGEQIRREAAYLLPTPLTMQSDFTEIVSPLFNARICAGFFPHIPALFVALIEAFLCRCVIFKPELYKHFTAIIDAILYAPLSGLTASLYRAIATAEEANDEK